jgi:hypothetical protein
MFPVRDADGALLTVYESWTNPRLFGFIAERRLELRNGEVVEPIDDKNFIVATTGELLTRV